MAFKPKIRYAELIDRPEVGHRIVIRLAEPHHRIPQADLQRWDNLITTSQVVKVNENGSFETLNTFYVPDGQ